MILLLSVGLLFLFANCGIAVCYSPGILAILVPCILLVNALPLLAQSAPLGKQLWFLTHGNFCLRVFLGATALSAPYQIVLCILMIREHPIYYLINLLLCFGVLALTFYIGIILIYCTSVQLGLGLRILCACMGLIPFANIAALVIILKETNREIAFESKKELLNRQRESQQICKTKYPVLLVHGVFFRDYKYFGYWGRIPGQLKRNGATVHFGNQPSAASIAECANFLDRRIRQITEETGCQKVNVIAHSKGGLDIRYAMAFCGTADYIASVTTVNTPHRGSRFADYMLTHLSPKSQHKICKAYDTALNKLGEPEADLMRAVRDLTTEHCIELDRRMTQPQGVLCRSIGSKMNQPLKGRFPTNFTGMMMDFIDTDHDGLVGVDSFAWGDDFQMLTTDTPQGISHSDIIDLNRTNLPGFDVREFYVQLVAELKEKGL
jgi:triacylglycerol lipase